METDDMLSEPTYKTEGDVKRFDERDTMFAREALVPGSPEEIEYNERFPEKKKVDAISARFIISKLESNSVETQVGRGIYDAFFTPPAALALPDMADGEVTEEPVDREPKEAAHRIKEFARRLGADDVRIGSLKPEWIYSHKGARPFFKDEGYRSPPYFKGKPKGYLRREDCPETPYGDLYGVCAGPGAHGDRNFDRRRL